jgi:hypothetical protein
MAIQRKSLIQWSLLMLTGMTASSQLHATSVLINNPSFEAQVLGVGGFTNNVLTNWTVVAAGADEVGAYHANTFTQPIPDGVNTAYINPGGEFFQDVGPLVANSTYSFSVFVGHRSDGIGFPPSYNIQLLDASTSATLASGIPSDPGAGNFVDFSLSFDSAAFGASVGHNIRIQFSNSISNTGIPQVNFDDVIMSYSPDKTGGVPEPSAFGLALLGLGVIGFACVRRSARVIV